MLGSEEKHHALKPVDDDSEHTVDWSKMSIASVVIKFSKMKIEYVNSERSVDGRSVHGWS